MSRRARRIETNRRAVSETLGYILVFSLVISTIGTVMIFGFSGLEDRQSVEQVNNVERAFDVLADNFDDMRRYEDPSRATEVRLAGGTLSLGEEVNITVGQGSNGEINGNQTSVDLDPLVYESDGGIVVYEAGVVFRVDDGQSLPRSETPIVVGEEVSIVAPILTDSGGGPTAISSEQTILIETSRIAAQQSEISANGNDLLLQVESPRADGWERQLNSEGLKNVSREGNRVTAQLAVNENGKEKSPERAVLADTDVVVVFRR